MDYIRVVAVTANIESLGKDAFKFRTWLEAVAHEIAEQKPHFAAIHLQGLAPQQRGVDVDDVLTGEKIFKKISEHPELKDHFESIHAFLDTEFDAANATGLGSVFLIKDAITTEAWDMKKNSFGFISDRTVLQDKLNRSSAVAKDSFPENTNPNMKQRSVESPRCGFLISKWKIFGRVFTFVNLQLSKKEDNCLEHSKEIQSEACLTRQDQVGLVKRKLKELSPECDDEAAVWAGAFNTELDQEKLLNDLSNCHHAVLEKQKDENGDLKTLNYYSTEGKMLITLEKRCFDLHETHDWFFGLCNGQMAKKYNKEIPRESFNRELFEAPIFFPPTSAYCFDKKSDKDSFLRTQCPSWTDRILFNKKFAEMTRFDSFSCSGEYYGVIGRNLDIGTHKPVALHATACVKGKH